MKIQVAIVTEIIKKSLKKKSNYMFCFLLYLLFLREYLKLPINKIIIWFNVHSVRSRTIQKYMELILNFRKERKMKNKKIKKRIIYLL